MADPDKFPGVGEKVATDFSGRLTVHTITEVIKGRSQSGVMYMLDPPVPKSSGGPIDAGWFVRF